MGWTAGGNPTSFIKTINEEMLKMSQGFALQCLGNITILSPVDTGRYRANNIISIGAPDTSFDMNKFDPENQSTMAAGQEILAKIPLGTFPVIYIQNNLPYCEALEDGHSRQAPLGVYGLSFQQANETFK